MAKNTSSIFELGDAPDDHNADIWCYICYQYIPRVCALVEEHVQNYHNISCSVVIGVRETAQGKRFASAYAFSDVWDSFIGDGDLGEVSDFGTPEWISSIDESLRPLLAETLWAVNEYTRGHGYPPSFRELAKSLSLKSVASAHDRLYKCKKHGVIEYDAKRARNVRITPKGKELMMSHRVSRN